MKMFSLDCFMIRSKESVKVGLKVFLLDLLELLQLSGLSFWKHGWRGQSSWQTLLPFKSIWNGTICALKMEVMKRSINLIKNKAIKNFDFNL